MFDESTIRLNEENEARLANLALQLDLALQARDPDDTSWELWVATLGQLRIEIRTREHAPPHFHVSSPRVNASLTIETCQPLHGSLSAHEVRIITEWHRVAKADLIRLWNESRPSDCPVGPIRPAA